MGEEDISEVLEERKLPPEEFRAYLYDGSEPDCTGKEAREIIQKGQDKLEKVGKKVCRAIIDSAEESEEVKTHLLKVEEYGDDEFNKLLKAIGANCSNQRRVINELRPGDFTLNWALFSAKYLLSNE